MSDSFPPVKKRPVYIGAILLAFVTSIAGGLGSSALRWWGGVATVGDIDRAIESCAKDEDLKAMRAELQQALGGKPTDEPIYVRLQHLESQTSIALVQKISVETRERVGLRVALARGLDPRRAKEAYEAARVARVKMDDLVLGGMTPSDAASRVLEQMGVPR